MYLKALSTACAIMVGCGAAEAQSVKLTADQITTLLSGNTAIGTWEGQAYRQFFGADGVTLYTQLDTPFPTRGEWRVDPERDEFQSIRSGDTEWEGWYVMEFAGDYFWVSKTTPPTPFEIEEGQRLVAP